jgi:hypothetical protein
VVDGVQDFACGVGAAVVDNDYVVALSEAAHHHVADALFVVIDGNHNAYPSVFELVFLVLHIFANVINIGLKMLQNYAKKR